MHAVLLSTQTHTQYKSANLSKVSVSRFRLDNNRYELHGCSTLLRVEFLNILKASSIFVLFILPCLAIVAHLRLLLLFKSQISVSVWGLVRVREQHAIMVSNATVDRVSNLGDFAQFFGPSSRIVF